MLQRRPRQHDGRHLAFIRQLPCIVCGDNTSTEAAHIRMADRTIGKRQTGKGEKPDDMYVLPFCGRHHRLQSEKGEPWFYQNIFLHDATKIAMRLYIAGLEDDHELADRICRGGMQ